MNHQQKTLNTLYSPPSGELEGAYPFGPDSYREPMPGRSYTNENYRFGFNGKENDEETNSQDYGWRWYNSGLARFWSVDPASPDFPMLSPYAFASNTPIWAMDIGGLSAWLTNDGASKIVSLEDWNNFVKTELKIVLDNQIKFDCADFALYLMARYHQARGLELTYVHPFTGKTISSSDPIYNDFNGFYWGIADDGKSFDGYPNPDNSSEKGALYSGLRGAFGASDMSLIATKIRASQIGNGDFYSSTIHVSVAFPNNGYDDDITLDPFVIFSGSNPPVVPRLSTVVSQENESNPLYRFNFLFNLPRVSINEIELKKAEPIPSSTRSHGEENTPFKKVPTVSTPSNNKNKKATKPNKANYSTKTPKNKK